MLLLKQRKRPIGVGSAGGRSPHYAYRYASPVLHLTRQKADRSNLLLGHLKSGTLARVQPLCIWCGQSSFWCGALVRRPSLSVQRVVARWEADEILQSGIDPVEDAFCSLFMASSPSAARDALVRILFRADSDWTLYTATDG
jgi:hypothetical protein